MINSIIRKVLNRNEKFSSIKYWDDRYSAGGNSGAGSYGEQANAKARILNDFIKENAIDSVIELGCGDGHQLTLANYPKYMGFDVSRKAIALCHERFNSDDQKSFFYYDPRFFYDGLKVFQADLVISLEVIFHIIEEDLFELYIDHLIKMSKKYIVVFSTDEERSIHLDKDGIVQKHLKHRNFSKFILSNYERIELMKVIDNPFEQKSDIKFHIFEKL